MSRNQRTPEPDRPQRTPRAPDLGVILGRRLSKRLQAWNAVQAKWVRAVTGYELIIATEYPDIQDAVAAVTAPGGVVYIPAGTYNATTPTKYSGNLLIATAGVRLVGDGPSTTILQAPANANPMLSIP